VGCPGVISENPAFFVYPTAAEGLQPLYRCTFSATLTFLTTAGNCEGGGNPVVLGYVTRSAACDSSPLLRYYRGVARDHASSVRADDQALLRAQGYDDQGATGFAWSTPGGSAGQ
jgi:hypothetical protein